MKMRSSGALACALGLLALAGCDNSVSAPSVQLPATPVPTATPVTTSITSSLPTLAFTSLGQTLTFTASGASGIAAISSNPAVVTVTPGSTAGSFTATAAGVGSATVTLSATGVLPATVPATVTLTNIVPQGRIRQ